MPLKEIVVGIALAPSTPPPVRALLLSEEHFCGWRLFGAFFVLFLDSFPKKAKEEELENNNDVTEK
jgi:hypothetical protein